MDSRIISKMSRTIHHRSQKHAKRGLDYGAKYKCDKGYCVGSGSYPKKLAAKERRIESKELIQNQLTDLIRVSIESAD